MNIIGKIYNLCRDMRAKDFKKDPEKYSKIAEEEVEKAAAKTESGENTDSAPESEQAEHTEIHQQDIRGHQEMEEGIGHDGHDHH